MPLLKQLEHLMLTDVLIDLTWKIPLVILFISFAEYMVHKHILHGKWLYKHGPSWIKFSYHDHDIEHHGMGINKVLPHIDLTAKDYFPILPFVIIAAVRYFYYGHLGGLSSLIAMSSMCLVHLLLWNHMHRAIHGVSPNNWASKLPWYNFIKRHHDGHHKDRRRNLNVVFPICDYLFRNVYHEPIKSGQGGTS
jgi:hypothetical protein